MVVEEKDFKKALNEQGLDYNDSYLISRNAVNDALMEHGGFDLMIDFHRDSLPRDNTFITSDGKNYAKLMCVLGGLSNHLSIIKERGGILFDKSNEQINGIMKPLLIREAYYNQDMSENMILIEVGSDQNTYQEVVNSLEILVNAVMKIWGEQ